MSTWTDEKHVTTWTVLDGTLNGKENKFKSEVNTMNQDKQATIHHDDCLTALRAMPDASVSAIVTDPPYGLSNTNPSAVADTITKWATGDREHVPTGRGFMGKAWDSFVPPPAVWDECLRVLKPGGHMVVFAGSRTQDLMGLSIRLAGFEIRDSVAWLYGTGFSKAGLIGNKKGVKWCECGGYDHASETDLPRPGGQSAGEPEAVPGSHVALDDGALRGRSECPRCGGLDPAYRGFSTAMKPAHEPVIVARKPLEGTVAANVQEHGTGALNIDACRVGTDGGCSGAGPGPSGGIYGDGLNGVRAKPVAGLGRWPANVVLDESQATELDRQSGITKSTAGDRGGLPGAIFGSGKGLSGPATVRGHNDAGGASRFFYTAKAPKSERPVVDGISHATVKPLSIMRWLIRLTTPPGGLVLDPFAGSGTTIEAAILEGFPVIGIEREADYLPLIQARIDRAQDD